MESSQKINYQVVPVIDWRWIIGKGQYILEIANGLRNRVRLYFEVYLGIPWQQENFNKAYFAEKMREARKRQEEAFKYRRFIVPNRERIQTMTSEIQNKDFLVIDDLFKGQNSQFGISKDLLLAFYQKPEYDYDKHKEAILNNAGYEEINFNRLPQVVPDRKLNRIFNFITLIFLQHYHLIELRQTPPKMDIWIRKTNQYLNVAD